MKLTIGFVSFALLFLCALTITSRAETIALEKRSAVFPFERALTQRIQQELDSLHAELAVPQTRVARQAPTDPGEGGSTGGGISGLLTSILRAVLLIPRGLISLTISIVDLIGRVVYGITNGISSSLTSLLKWLSGI